MTVETVILSYAADDDGDKNVTLMIFLLRRRVDDGCFGSAGRHDISLRRQVVRLVRHIDFY